MDEQWRPCFPPVTATALPVALAENPIVVIHFWAIWNGVDRRFTPTLVAVEREYGRRIAFRAADVDDPAIAPLCEEFGIGNVPALACFVHGRRLKTIVGMRSEEQLRAELRGLIAASEGLGSGDAAARTRRWWQFWR